MLRNFNVPRGTGTHREDPPGGRPLGSREAGEEARDTTKECQVFPGGITIKNFGAKNFGRNFSEGFKRLNVSWAEGP